MKQGTNNVCVISALKSVFHTLTIDNTCNRTCANRTQEVQFSKKELVELGLSTTLVLFQNVTDVVCHWNCPTFSPLKAIPYKTNPVFSAPFLHPRYAVSGLKVSLRCRILTWSIDASEPSVSGSNVEHRRTRNPGCSRAPSSCRRGRERSSS